jgi:cyclopropane-fatty-acyl-phospholipid synthase
MSILDFATGLGINIAESGLVPDVVMRVAIRRLCQSRLDAVRAATEHGGESAFLASLTNGPIAIKTDSANEQHYEMPADFFASVLGPRLKYSCCYWPDGVTTLGEAEEEALSLTCAHAELVDGQNVLELGCGWGSLTLWMAERYPASCITAMSNSHSQRIYIEQQMAERGLTNVQLVTADINSFVPMEGTCYDRVISVEMFEHLRNIERLFERIAAWLVPGGKLLTHVFCHRCFSYPFQPAGKADWMARNFFTGGMMPSADIFRRFDGHLHIEREWTWNGEHYRRTAEAWLANLDANRDAALDCLRGRFGTAAGRCLQRWRMFFLAVAELFGYQHGHEWYVTHTLLAPDANR